MSKPARPKYSWKCDACGAVSHYLGSPRGDTACWECPTGELHKHEEIDEGQHGSCWHCGAPVQEHCPHCAAVNSRYKEVDRG